VHKKLKVVVLFEGRDAAGKGGVIKRITQRLNPRVCRVARLAGAERARAHAVVLSSATCSHLPAAGEIVLFDRSWYNRAGVEKVMGFCSDEDYEEFFRTVPEFEKMLIRSGIILIKYWFSITDDEQNLRFMMRIHDPLKQWKLSPMDMESRRRWEHYTKAKETMLDRTHIPEAPWWIVEAVDKKKARLNCIHHLLEPDSLRRNRTRSGHPAGSRAQPGLSAQSRTRGHVRARCLLKCCRDGWSPRQPGYAPASRRQEFSQSVGRPGSKPEPVLDWNWPNRRRSGVGAENKRPPAGGRFPLRPGSIRQACDDAS
jgi:polyphosphate kinase 2